MRASATRGEILMSVALRCHRWVAALALALALPALAHGQGGSTTATVRGTVSDTSGGVLPGATVTITDAGTKATRNTVSDDRGGYLFSGLFPGTYTVKVELQGFKTYEQTNLVLSPADTRGVDVAPRSRPVERGRLGDLVAGDHPDGDGRPRRRAPRRPDREAVDHRPQLARAPAHPAWRRRARRQHDAERGVRHRRQQHAGAIRSTASAVRTTP